MPVDLAASNLHESVVSQLRGEGGGGLRDPAVAIFTRGAFRIFATAFGESSLRVKSAPLVTQPSHLATSRTGTAISSAHFQICERVLLRGTTRTHTRDDVECPGG